MFKSRNVKSSPIAPRVQGFTLIELLVTLTILAIISAYAVPTFQSMIIGNAINSSANNLQIDLNYARSEALKRGVSTTACVSTNSTSCADSDNWHLGWIIFVDQDSNNARDTNASASEDLVRVNQPTSTDTFTITTISGSAVKTIRFNRTGSSSAEGLKISPVNTTYNVGRALCLATTGRTRLTERGTESC
ncbi:GspH/FimT family pseudopilin [Undibacterium sp.]|uniref:GspH/FimT family pseudopilin n=1 Tax=Undibacterium sp. TaxID=1914977 RepID=UPI003752AB31